MSRKSQVSGYGEPLFPFIDYCVRCCMPITSEGLTLDEMGICQPCRSSEQKIHIDWKERGEQLRKILESYRGKSESGYDCIVPISGGKDSTFQLYVLTQVYKMRCLAVTFNHNWYSETGKKNLQTAIEAFNVDHIMYTPNHDLIKRLAKASLQKIGDPCWHCHAGVGAFPLQIAVRFNIPLLLWGESAAEAHGRATYEEPIKYDRDYFTKLSARYYAEEMVSEDISLHELKPFMLPSYHEIDKNGIVGLHIGDYIFWDDERQMEFVRDTYGWKEDYVEGTYKGYKSVECRMAGLHDYTKFLKRGFGRATDHACKDVRAGLLTREEGLELAKIYDTARPDVLNWFLEYANITEVELMKIMKTHREKVMGKELSKKCEATGLF